MTHPSTRTLPFVLLTACWALSALLAPTRAAHAQCEVNYASSIRPSSPMRSTEAGVTGDWTAIVVTDRAPRYCEPDPRQRLQPAWSFGDKVFVYAGQNNYYLVGDAGGGQLSWMHDSDVQVWRRSMKDDKHHTWRKALIINNPFSEEDAEATDQVPLYGGAGEGHAVRDRVNLFSVRFVYKEKKVRDRVFFLVGREQRWSDHRLDSALDGWVDAELVINWPHRMAMEIDKSTLAEREPVGVFKRLPELADHVRDPERKVPRDAVWGYEDASDRSGWPHDQERFPILDYNYVSRDDREIKAYEIGYIGDTFRRGGRKPKRVDRKEITPIKEIQSSIRQLDLLFVMDATASMQPYFEAVKQSVVDFVERARQQSRVQLSVVLYRDHADGRNRFEILQEPTTDVDAFLRSLRGARAYSSHSDSTMTEAMLDGVRDALDVAKFRQGSTRAMLLIGDHGSPDSAQARADLVMIQTLLERDRLAVHAVQVQPRGSAHRLELSLFRQQAEQLAATMGDAGSFTVVPPGGSAVSRAADEILGGLKATARQSEASFEAIEDLSGGMSVEEAEKKWGFTLVKNVGRLLKNEWGVESLTDLDLSRYQQLCLIGWVAEHDPRSGARAMFPVLFIEKAELGAFVGALNRLHDALTAREDRDHDITQLITRAIEAATGDKHMRRGESYEDFIQRAFGLPVKSRLFKLTEDRLREKLRAGGQAVREELLDTVARSRTYLQAAADDRRVVAVRQGRGAYVERPAGSERWFYRDRTGEHEYAWIPYDYFP